MTGQATGPAPGSRHARGRRRLLYATKRQGGASAPRFRSLPAGWMEMAIRNDGAYTPGRSYREAARGPEVARKAADTRMRRDDAADLLRAFEITPTARRIDVAAVLLSRPQHVCAEDLQQMLAGHGTSVSKATVYNTLGLFARKGLVRELFVDSDKVLYDSNTTNHNHIYDVDTGALTDIEPGAVEVGALPALPPGMLVESVEIVIRVRRRPRRA